MPSEAGFSEAMGPVKPARRLRRLRGLRSAAPLRRRFQAGQEFMEFALTVGFFLFPAFLGMFTAGMNMLITLQAKGVSRDVANLYIHGTDFSTYSAQQLTQTLAGSLNFQMPAFGSGVTNQQTNTGASLGNGVFVVSQLMWIGASTAPNCVSATAAGFTCNSNQFVFLQQIVFGSSTIYAAHPNPIGAYSPSGSCGLGGASTAISSSGTVPSPVWNTCAKLSASAATTMTNAYTANAAQTALIDGQTVYLVESYFDTSWFNFPGYSTQGVYSRYFF